MDSLSEKPVVETSARYDGWRIVAVCFLVATFGWAFGFYGQSVYLAELHRLHGWSASLISAATTFFYLFGALIVAFVSEAVRAFGPRNCLLGGVVTMAAAAVMIGQVTAMKPADYQEWLHAHAEGSLALQGRKTFLKYRCLSCHSAIAKSAPGTDTRDVGGFPGHPQFRATLVAAGVAGGTAGAGHVRVPSRRWSWETGRR